MDNSINQYLYLNKMRELIYQIERDIGDLPLS